MNQLAERLKVVNDICTEAYPHIERAAALREEIAPKTRKERRQKIIKTVVLSYLMMIAITMVYFLLMGGQLQEDRFQTFGSIVVVVSVAFGITLYRKKYMAKINATEAASYALADKEESLGTRLFEENAELLSILPDDYWYPLATNYIYKVVMTGRAENVNQALTMFDEQLHRWKIEDANAAIVEQQIAQTTALKGIRKSNAINAAANVTNAVFNIVSRL